MPKINAEGMPSSAGMTGHVVNARDEIHEVDPSRNADGTVRDGYESDARELQDDENYRSPAVGEPPVPTEDNPAYRKERDGDPDHPSNNDGNTEDQRRERGDQDSDTHDSREASVGGQSGAEQTANPTKGTTAGSEIPGTDSKINASGKNTRGAESSPGSSSSASPKRMGSTPGRN
jgi:hypothetical protein